MHDVEDEFPFQSEMQCFFEKGDTEKVSNGRGCLELFHIFKHRRLKLFNSP